MEMFGILLGMIFWPTIWRLWRQFCRNRHISRGFCRLGLGALMGLSAWAAFFILHGLFIDEPFLMAVEQGQTEKARHYLHLGADINNYDEFGHTPLTLAIQRNNITLVKLLLERGADVQQPGSDTVSYGLETKTKSSPLALAERSCNQETVRLLKQAGAHH